MPKEFPLPQGQGSDSLMFLFSDVDDDIRLSSRVTQTLASGKPRGQHRRTVPYVALVLTSSSSSGVVESMPSQHKAAKP